MWAKDAIKIQIYTTNLTQKYNSRDTFIINLIECAQKAKAHKCSAKISHFETFEINNFESFITKVERFEYLNKQS